jgi:hypothetical protein
MVSGLSRSGGRTARVSLREVQSMFILEWSRIFVLWTVWALGAKPSTVLTREGLNLHKFLCACADRPAGVDGLSIGAKIGLGRNNVFLFQCITDCSGFEPGQY